MDITPEDRQRAKQMLVNAAQLSNKYGTEIVEEAEDSREALVAMAIMLSSLGASMGCTMHDLMGLLMEVHKKTMEMDGKQ